MSHVCTVRSHVQNGTSSLRSYNGLYSGTVVTRVTGTDVVGTTGGSVTGAMVVVLAIIVDVLLDTVVLEGMLQQSRK